MGILDTIIDNQHQTNLRELELTAIVSKILAMLKEREKYILTKRYGLHGEGVSTLKTVGEEQGLTRERVRQIEKDLIKNLRKNISDERTFQIARELIMNTISEHGGIMSEASLLDFLNIEDPKEENAAKFILHLIAEVEPLHKDKDITPSWMALGHNKTLLKEFIAETKKIFTIHGKPLTTQDFVKQIKASDFYIKNSEHLNDKVIVNYLNAAAEIKENIFGEYGLHDWPEVKPKDVGDKAYLVMRHHGKPEHYSTITELINKHALDHRTAYKETVHNKLIKDKRFVLVGRGIYALAEWGYKPGVVSEMIRDVLLRHQQPLTRDQIVEEVLKSRLVKKNTILVGLSNKKYFRKVGKNFYTIAE
jgi:hypothetical protein